MFVEISSALVDGMIAEAARTPDVEVCGLLFGTMLRVASFQPTRNVAADPAHHFEIDPAALLAAHKAERVGDARLLGHYHSHPSGAGAPSLHDRAASSGTGRLWIIIAAGNVTAWREQGANDFETCRIHIC